MGERFEAFQCSPTGVLEVVIFLLRIGISFINDIDFGLAITPAVHSSKSLRHAVIRREIADHVVCRNVDPDFAC